MTTCFQDLIDAGVEAGPWLPSILEYVNQNNVHPTNFKKTEHQLRETNPNWEIIPKVSLDNPSLKPLHVFLTPQNELEQTNLDAVLSSMKKVLSTPCTKSGAIMPDACPTGPHSIPVGGVVASTHIMPGGHSADVCCSMFLTKFEPTVSPKLVLNAVHSVTHFGTGPKKDNSGLLSHDLLHKIKSNPLTAQHLEKAKYDYVSQGDGNHFAFVGTDDDGYVYLITHHGSRGFGARSFKDGKKKAVEYMKKHCPEVPSDCAFLPDSDYADDYWEELQIVRQWTRANHHEIHKLACKELGDPFIQDQFWNEHNFVFKKDDGLFYHAKGATPAYRNDTQIIPMNMGQPILLVTGQNNEKALGFAPHGAGRNFSRTHHKNSLSHRSIDDIIKEETKGLDVRFFSGIPDISELPSAYKCADTVRTQMQDFNLAKVHTMVYPYGCIMNGM